MRQAAAARQPDTRGNEKHHGDANAADIGFDLKRDAEKVADEHADQRADGEKSNAEDRHRTTLRPRRQPINKKPISKPPCIRTMLSVADLYTLG